MDNSFQRHPREEIRDKADRALLERLISTMKNPRLTYDMLFSALAKPLRNALITPEELAVEEMVEQWREEYSDITPGELAAILSGHISREAKYCVRVERHGDAGKPGGLADP